MDLKMPIHMKKQWMIPIVCALGMLLLGITVLAFSLPAEQQMETPPTGTIVTTTVPLPSTEATEPSVPAEPTLPAPPAASDATIQLSVSKATKPPALELSTLKKKDFKKVNGYITCKTEEYWLGIDVSQWQRDIDWEKVAGAGVKFVMIRMAYRGWGSDAKLFTDPRALSNLEGAQAAGLKVGVYLYSQAINVKEAVEEARYLLNLLDGRHLEMPVVFDWETPANSSARTWKVKPKTLQQCALAFCKEVRDAGYQPMVYLNQSQGIYQYNLEELRAAGIDLWLAMYTNALTYKYKVQMWQYTGKGRVPGISTKVDINLYFPYH